MEPVNAQQTALEHLLSDDGVQLRTLTDPTSVSLEDLRQRWGEYSVVKRPERFDAKFTLEEVVAAYHMCRANKSGTQSAIEYELDWEAESYKLWTELRDGTYMPGPSIVFVVDRPVKREVFAAAFRDRVVHHLVYNKLIDIFESMFSDDSYSTRVGKGTLYGINRVEQMVKDCSENYTVDCYILKVDIKGFFMSIDKKILFNIIETVILMYYDGEDRDLLVDTVRKIIFNRPEENCIRKCPVRFWQGLPPEKSLFYSDGMHGLPIGNLTSQIFALMMLNLLDHTVKNIWGIQYYGRYVDDMVMVDRSKEKLLEVYGKLGVYLYNIGLKLHPKKFYLQHYSKGVLFTGGMIKPGRKYVSNRTVGNFYNAIEMYNKIANKGYVAMVENVERFRATMNSYFGILGNFDEKRLCVKVIHKIDRRWYRLMTIKMSEHKCKVVVKRSVIDMIKLKHKEIFFEEDEEC